MGAAFGDFSHACTNHIEAAVFSIEMKKAQSGDGAFLRK
jgi:hypothetical protein